MGLRRVLLPSIAVGAVCGSILPFVGYQWLVGLVALAGLFTIPSFTLIRQSGETGVLYGSVSTRDIAEIVTKNGFSVERGQIVLNHPIKTLGLFKVPVTLHPEVEVEITVNVARSPEEAERQARGETVIERDSFNLDDLGLEVGAALADAGEQGSDDQG